MDIQHYFTFVAALAFVLALIMLLAWIAKRLGLGGVVPVTGRQRRLSVVEAIAVDAKHRLVLVRRDDVEHLLLVGNEGDLVVESGIRPLPFAAVVAAAEDQDRERSE